MRKRQQRLVRTCVARPAFTRYQIGETFIELSRDAIEARIGAEEANLKEEASRAQTELDEIRAEMARLKVLLYAKFKSSINLESDEAA